MAKPATSKAHIPVKVTGTKSLPEDFDQFIKDSIKAACSIQDGEWVGQKEKAIWLGAPRLPEVRYDSKEKDITHDTIPHPADRQLIIVLAPELVTIAEGEEEVPLVRIGYDMGAKCTVYVRGDVYDVRSGTEDVTEISAAFRRREYGI